MFMNVYVVWNEKEKDKGEMGGWVGGWRVGREIGLGGCFVFSCFPRGAWGEGRKGGVFSHNMMSNNGASWLTRKVKGKEG